MRPKYRFPVRVEDTTIQLFGHLSWRDVARILIPVAAAVFLIKTGVPFVPPVAVLAAGLVAGVAWWRVRVDGLPVEVYVYRGSEYVLRSIDFEEVLN